MWSEALLLAAVGLAQPAASQIDSGPAGAPFPNSYYPGFADPNALAGAKFNQTSPPFYPSPWVDGSGGWDAAIQKAKALVKQMTLAEKVNITTGVGWESERCVGQTGGAPRLGFRSMCMQDSPLGVRDTDYNSGFPAGVNIAATWDRSLMYQRGFDMGSEHKGKGVDVQLGPVVGPLGRAPEGGRNWEGFSPDPVLSGIAVSQSVQGIQAAGVIACTKHFILNEQEHFRQAGEAQGYGFNITESLSSNIDDTTMHELYLWPFADAIRAGTGSIMCSYNQINNSYGCSNSYTLNKLLKGELGFQGFVMSDWGAHHSGVGDGLAGLDMSMPGDTSFNSGQTFWGTNLTIAVLNGTYPEWRIDDMATRIVAAWYYVGRDKSQVPINFDSWTLDTYSYQHFYASKGYTLVNEHVDVQGNHAADIRNMGAKSTVLLKNTNNALPLTGKEKFTAVFGYDSADNPYGPNGCPDRGCDNGTLAMGWGSGTANFPFLSTPLSAIQNEVAMAGGNGVVQGITDNYAYTQIESLAKAASVAIVFVNADSGEGYISVDGNEGDRNNLTVWDNGEYLIKNVTGYCNNTMVVIHSTGPVLLTNFYQNPNVTAILWAGIPGEQSGNSLADVLYGRVNPSAKLPFTLGKTRQSYGTDLLYKPNNGKFAAPQQQFGEGKYIDYRAFDKKNETPIYEFGFGLSYTTFSISNLSVASHSIGTYSPTTGMTDNAPTLGSAGSASSYVYPKNLTRIPFYIYPYLNSTNLKKSSGDPHYGEKASQYIPPGATDGTAQPKLGAGGGPGGNPELYDVAYTVSAMVQNTGKVAGDEVVQLYINHGGPNDPKVVLRQFEKVVGLQPGESRMVSMDLTRRDLSNWDTVSQNWVITKYPKTVYVGNSSRKLPLSQKLPPINSGYGPGNGTTPRYFRRFAL